MRRSASIVGCAYVIGLVACSGEAPSEDVARVRRDLSLDAVLVPAADGATVNAAALSPASSCDVLLAELQSDLLEQVSARAAQARVSPDYYYGGGVFIDDVVPQFSAPAPAPDAAVAGGSAFTGFSRTTVTVSGVDEGDFVKADGDRIYLIHGSSLFVLDAADASATQVVASIPIEGSPLDLFVSDGKVVVLSGWYGPLPGSDDADALYYYYYYPSYVKLTVLEETGDVLGVRRESFVEGNYSGSRRHGDVVRTLVQQASKAQLDYPNVSYVDIFGNRRSQAEVDLQVDLWVLLSTESIEDSTIEDYLPASYERVGGALVRQPLDCEDYLLPGPGLVQAGATSVVALDLDALDAPLETATVLGYAEGVYANDDVLLVRQTDYGDYTSPLPAQKTNIHRFELNGTRTTYTASGSVQGYVSSAFGLDEVGGVVRVLTIEDQYENAADAGEGIVYVGSANRIITLGADQGVLAEIGRSPAFGSGDYLYANRFVGRYGYASTFGQTGHFFVVDLSDPASPTIVGQTSASSYTNLIAPLPDDHLLGIGQGADANGNLQNTALQLFDVSDATAPSVTHEYVFAEASYADASYDQRALGFNPGRGLLSFSLQNYLTGLATLEVLSLSFTNGFDHLASITPTPAEPTFVECLALFGYSTDPEFVAVLEQDPAFVEAILQECRYYTQSSARRGLFRGDDLFLVHARGVGAYSLDALSGPPLSEVDLPLAYPYYYNPLLASAPAPAPAPVAPIPDEASAGAAGSSFQ